MYVGYRTESGQERRQLTEDTANCTMSGSDLKVSGLKQEEREKENDSVH